MPHPNLILMGAACTRQGNCHTGTRDIPGTLTSTSRLQHLSQPSTASWTSHKTSLQNQTGAKHPTQTPDPSSPLCWLMQCCR